MGMPEQLMENEQIAFMMCESDDMVGLTWQEIV
jgi:hypothetical protein